MVNNTEDDSSPTQQEVETALDVLEWFEDQDLEEDLDRIIDSLEQYKQENFESEDIKVVSVAANSQGTFICHGNSDGTVEKYEYPTVDSAIAEYISGDIGEDKLEDKIESALLDRKYDLDNEI